MNNNNRVLITGGTGELGQALVPRLQAAGYKVRITSRSPAPADKAPDIEWVQVDLMTGEVADRMVEIVQAGPSGRVPDIAGPKVQRAAELAKVWLKARGKRRLLLPLPLFGGTAEGFKKGLNTAPSNAYGRITFSEWLNQKYS